MNVENLKGHIHLIKKKKLKWYWKDKEYLKNKFLERII